MAKQYKNDIFEVIKQIDKKNYQYFDSLSLEQQKEIQPYVLMRWISVVGDEDKHIKYTQDTNNNVNMYFWELSKYKDLQWKLLCTCGQSGFNRHQWIPMSKSNNDKDFKAIRGYFSHLNEQEFAIKYKSMNKDEIKKIKQFLGLEEK